MLERIFHIKESGSSLGNEAIGGCTTFLTMAYIIFVQPAVLSMAGMDFGAVMVGTCISSAIATFLMGFLANYPVALAPGMGENFFFVFNVVIGMSIAWPEALGAVFIAGLLFILLTILQVRKFILNVIPDCLKAALPAAIGLFIAFIGMVDGGIVAKHPAGGIVWIGDLHHPAVLLTIFGLFAILFLMARKVHGAILIGMLVTMAVGVLMRLIPFKFPVSLPPSVAPVFAKMDIIGALKPSLIPVIIVFLFMDLFDTMGTLIGVGEQAGLMKDGKLPRANRALLADSIGTVAGAVLGNSTVTSYIESATGVQEGSRTGLSNVFTGTLFLFALFFSPLVAMVGGGIEIAENVRLHPVTAPALIIVGSMMARHIARVKWDDITEAMPAFLTIIGMPLTYSITHGLAFGFVSYPILKLFAGKGRSVHWILYVLAVVILLKYGLLSMSVQR